MKYCPNCGNPVDESVNFCSNCGSTLNSIDEAQPKNNDESLASNGKADMHPNETTPTAPAATEPGVVKKDSFGDILKNKIASIWGRLDVFSKVALIGAGLIVILSIIAFCVGKLGPILISILQIGAIISAVLMHKGIIKLNKNWIKYLVLGMAILLSVANIALYSAGKHAHSKPSEVEKPPVIEQLPQSSDPVETTVYAPLGASECVGKPKADINKAFSAAGFTNITEEKLVDLEYSDSQKDQGVASVSIDGSSDYASNKEFKSSSRVVITYHTFKEIQSPMDSETAELMDPDELVKTLSAAGFGDITTSEVIDLDPDSSDSEFQNDVEINGFSSFTKASTFPVNAKINILTHRAYEKYTLKVIVDFVPNLIFSKYDVDLDVNGETYRLSHGEDGEFVFRLKSGKYSVVFTNAESSSVKGTTEIELKEDTEISYKIHCYNDKITVESVKSDVGNVLAEDEAAIPMVGTDCKYRNYKEIEEAFRSAGFINISTEVIYDIDSSSIRREGDVEKVTVDGQSIFKRGEVFKNDVPVIITYHTRVEADPNELESAAIDEKEESDSGDSVYYSTNDNVKVKEGNEGIYSYYRKGKEYNNYVIIDFDEGYVYYFLDNESTCEKVKIDSGDLNDKVIFTYHDGDAVWQEAVCFKWVRNPATLLYQDADANAVEFKPFDLDDALKIRDTKTIKEY